MDGGPSGHPVFNEVDDGGTVHLTGATQSGSVGYRVVQGVRTGKGLSIDSAISDLTLT